MPGRGAQARWSDAPGLQVMKHRLWEVRSLGSESQGRYVVEEMPQPRVLGNTLLEKPKPSPTPHGPLRGIQDVLQPLPRL